MSAWRFFRRGLRGLPVFRPDRKHIHHHLIGLGFSRERTVLILYSVSFACLSLAFGVFWLQGRFLPLFSGLLFLVLVFAGHLAGFTRDWQAIGGQLAQLLKLRKETRHAIILSQWLEMEAERHRSVNEIWQDYQFVVKKLGFSQVRLVLRDGAHMWQAEGFDESGDGIQHIRHEAGEGSVLEFAADSRVLPEYLFKLLADLAAETWHKAESRWRTLNKTSPPLIPVAALPGFFSQRKFNRFYTPVGR